MKTVFNSIQILDQPQEYVPGNDRGSQDHWSNHIRRGCLAGELELEKESKQANKRDQSGLDSQDLNN